MKSYLTLDLETECADSSCHDSDCRHGLDHNRNRILVAGVYKKVPGEEARGYVFREVAELKAYLMDHVGYTLVGHNIISFDLKTLKAKGVDLTDWDVEDTQLMACSYTNKVTPHWLEQYDIRRKELNRLANKKVHREAGQHSLKTLAPYFLNVPPFWETASHDNDDYVLDDCKNTWHLFEFLEPKLKEEGTHGFYRDWLLPKAQMLSRAEQRGITIDLDTMNQKSIEADYQSCVAKEKLDKYWDEAFQAYKKQQELEICKKYAGLAGAARDKLKPDKKTGFVTQERRDKVRARYDKLRSAALEKIEPFNINSTAQLAWLLRDYLGYNIKSYEGEESTKAEVLERLAAEGKEDVKALVDYRHANKLVTSFFPSYRDHQVNGVIHCNFNVAVARTGRLSCSEPNLQQQPAHVKDIFIARPGKMLITKDYSGIEPVVAAYYTQDPILCDIILRGGNFHGANTPSFFSYVNVPEDEVKAKFPVERDAAKELGLLTLYGGGKNRIRISKMKRGFQTTLEECKEQLDNYRERYKGVWDFKTKVLDPMLEQGKTITNLFGRKFKVSREDVYMKGLNTLIQGSASDLLLNSAQRMEEEFKRRGIDAYPLLWVHDELVVEVPEDRVEECESIIETCTTDYNLMTPMGKLPLKIEGNTARYWSK